MKIYNGDLLLHFADYSRPIVSAIAHVCNCQGVMGSGVALAIKMRYPEAYQAYKNFELSHSGLKVGTMSFAAVRPDKLIYNLHAQMYYGSDKKRYLDYEGLYTALEKVCGDMCFRGIDSIAVPFKMGADRAGGDWNVVTAMLTSVFEPHGIKVIAVKL
jgi:O-acetyl-ADP-ribose deacetylase (regulator of RNase III)